MNEAKTYRDWEHYYHNPNSIQFNDMYNDSGIVLELQGTGNNIDPWRNCVSASRGTMMPTHLTQAPPIKVTTSRKCTTGVHDEYGKYTSAITMPADGTVITTIPKFRIVGHGVTGIRSNPKSLMVFDNHETGEVDCLELKSVRSDHVTFGYKYKYRDVDKSDRAGIPKDTIIASSGNLRQTGEYNFGIEANIVFMSHPACIEDGVVITNEFCRKIASDNILQRVFNYDDSMVPLNTYGDEDDYRTFADVGQRVREDGVLFAAREICPVFGFLELTKKSLMQIKPTDKCCYVPKGAVVNDISAYRGKRNKKTKLPVSVTKQTEEYADGLSEFFASVRSLERDLFRIHGQAMRLSPQLHKQMVYAKSDDNKAVKHRVRRVYRHTPLKDYRVEFELVYELEGKVGIKITDLHGGKAVAVRIIKAEDAPYDAWGTRADIIIDGTTCNDRVNPGRLFEQYINASGDQVVRRLKRYDDKEKAFEYLLSFYAAVSMPNFGNVIKTFVTRADKIAHVNYVINNGISHFIPPNTKDLGLQQVNNMEESFPLEYGPVRYRDLEGVWRETVDPMYIGSIYIILLEKTGDDWSAVSVSKQQHFGLPAKLSAADKFSDAVRKQAVRILGESEVRLLASVLGGDFVNRSLLMASSPTVIKSVIYQILTSRKPGKIDKLKIDDSAGNQNRALQYTKNILYCWGIKLASPKNVGGMEHKLKQVKIDISKTGTYLKSKLTKTADKAFNFIKRLRK